MLILIHSSGHYPEKVYDIPEEIIPSIREHEQAGSLEEILPIISQYQLDVLSFCEYC